MESGKLGAAISRLRYHVADRGLSEGAKLFVERNFGKCYNRIVLIPRVFLQFLHVPQ